MRLYRAGQLIVVLFLGRLRPSDSNSGAFGFFLRIINWSPVDKLAQQVSNKKSYHLNKLCSTQVLNAVYQVSMSLAF